MKSTLGRRLAGIGYGFLFGAAAGLTAGVLLRNLWPWTVAGVAAGVAVGLLVAVFAAWRGRPEPR